MTWIQTRNGIAFDLEDPQPDMVCIEDICHALSLLCRFTGHVREFYSVAQHSFHVSCKVPEPIALEGLLHDAAEAYVGDMPAPLKRMLPFDASPPGFTYREMEHRAANAVAARFDLRYPWPREVKDADLRMLITEARDLLGPSPKNWEVVAEPYPGTFGAFDSRHAAALFMAQYERLKRCP